MAEFIKKIFAVILSFLQMLVLNVSYGDYVEPEKSEKEETQLVFPISTFISLYIASLLYFGANTIWY